MRARTSLLVFVLGSVGCHNCGNDEPIEESDTDPFAGSDGCGFICTSDGSSSTGAFTTTPLDDTGGGTTSSTTGGGEPQDECSMSADCGPDLFCVAPFDQTLGPEGKGPYACVSACVPLVDEDLWCADASACCDPNAICTDRGYCELPDGTTGGSDSGGSSDSGGDSSGESGSGSSGGDTSGG